MNDSSHGEAAPPSPARALIAAAGLSPSEDEMAVFEMMYPLLRAKADSVYGVAAPFDA